MPSVTTQLSDSKIRLILAAEKNFAEHGIEGASLREISLAAGHGNTAAVQYHFKTKEVLAYAVFSYRVEQMEKPRGDMLAIAEEQGLLSDPRTLLEMLWLPHLELVDDRGRHSYAGFLIQYLLRNEPMGMPFVGNAPVNRTHNLAISKNLRRINKLLEERIAWLPPELATSRIMLCSLAFLNMLVRWDNRPASSERSHESFMKLVADTIEIATAALCAPAPRTSSFLSRHNGG